MVKTNYSFEKRQKQIAKKKKKEEKRMKKIAVDNSETSEVQPVPGDDDKKSIGPDSID